MQGIPLTQETVDRILAYARAGYTNGQIAVFTGFCASTVSKTTKRHGIHLRSAQKIKIHPPDLIESLLHRGMSYREIAELLGCSKSGVWAFCQRHGMVPLRDRPGEIDLIFELRKQGKTFAEIAKTVQRSETFVSTVLKVQPRPFTDQSREPGEVLGSNS